MRITAIATRISSMIGMTQSTILDIESEAVLWRMAYYFLKPKKQSIIMKKLMPSRKFEENPTITSRKLDMQIWLISKNMKCDEEMALIKLESWNKAMLRLPPANSTQVS
ncbi:hypothetical protein Trydic_g834 [Trypoxylus dichotomus]